MKVFLIILFTGSRLFAIDSESAFDAYLKPFSQANGPGLAVQVIQNERIIFGKAYGFRKLEDKKPISLRTRFELASVSKQLTAMGLMILKEVGLIHYEMPLTQFFPELPFAKEVTLRQLLHHTGGLPDYMDLCRKGRPIYNTDVIEWLSLQSKLDFKPGSRHEYSNTGYSVLASVIERVSGLNYPEFMQRYIFKPIGMQETFVNEMNLPEGREIARAYSGWPFLKPMIEPQITDCNTIYGDGSVYSTAIDMTKWDRELDRHTLVTPKTLAEAFVPGKTDDGKTFPYGFGWRLSPIEGYPAISHSGSWGGFHNLYLRLPEKRFSLLLLSNYDELPSEKIMKKAIEYFLGRATQSQRPCVKTP